MKTFCFIPAKAASKRLKKKNLLKLNGKELIYYPIWNAINSGIFDENDIILSSESTEIKKIAKNYGANVPYLRENKLAHDPFGVVDVLLDFLDKFPQFQSYDSAAILLPTAPFTSVSDIKDAYSIYNQNNFKSIMSVTETEHRAQRSVTISNQKLLPLFPKTLKKKSQELEPTYRINGAVTIINIKAFLYEKSYFIHPIGTIKMPKERSVDIDNEEDYKFAKYLSNNNKD